MLATFALAWGPPRVSYTSQFGCNNLTTVLGKISIDDKPQGAVKTVI